MKVSASKIENSQMVLDIEVEPTEVEESLEASYRRLVQSINVPGFRKGKAPRVMLERHIGRETLMRDALKKLIPDVCSQAIRERELDAIAEPKVEILELDPVKLEATVPVRPSVKLGDYRNIRLTPQLAEVGDENVDRVMEQLRDEVALWEPVERPVALGDLAVIDIKGYAGDSPFLDEKGFSYLVVENSSPLSGLAQQLVGMEVGQQKEFSLSYPADYEMGELAGKECLFKVKMGEIKEKRLPELDDELAKSVGQGFDSVAALRGRVGENLKSLAEAEAKRQFEEEVLKAVADVCEVEFSSALVGEEIDRLLAQRSSRFGEGRVGLEAYLRSEGKTEDALREELKPLAVERVAHSLILAKVAEEEKIDVTDEEVDSEIESMRGNGGEWQKLFDSPAARSSIRQMLLTRKTMNRLAEIAEGDGGSEL